MIARTCAGVREGSCASSNAASPETWGVAAEVPHVACIIRVGIGASPASRSAGADTATFALKLLQLAAVSSAAVPATESTSGYEPG